jgi:hypothetical protein
MSRHLLKILRFVFLFMTLAGFLALNYGFANWVVLVFGLRIPLGHALALIALLLSLPGNWKKAILFLKEPAVLAFIGLTLLAMGHLIFDLKRYGGYAARDASFLAESVFLLLGFLWAQNEKDRELFLRGLLGVFLITFFYALTAVRADVIMAVSPVSGVFQRVSIFGNYCFIVFPLQVGALFFILVAPQMTRWSLRSLWVLAILQIGWMFYFQHRSSYVTLIVIVVLVLALEGIRKTMHICALHAGGFVTLIAVASLLGIWGISLMGRNGDIGVGFYMKQIKTFNPKINMERVTTADWRLKIAREAVEHWLATPTTTVVGEGFGRPLTSLEVPGLSIADTFQKLKITVRQPHNIHLTILARLGLVGFAIWLYIQARFVFLFVRSLRKKKKDSFEYELALWLFLFFITGIILASFQPWIEWPFGAIPFFIVLGFALAFISPHFEKTAEKEVHVV